MPNSLVFASIVVSFSRFSISSDFTPYHVSIVQMGMEIFIASCNLHDWNRNLDFHYIFSKRNQGCRISNVNLFINYSWSWSYFLIFMITIFLLRPLDATIRRATLFYFPTHIRCGAWIVGVVIGYMFYSTKNKRIVINKVRWIQIIII